MNSVHHKSPVMWLRIFWGYFTFIFFSVIISQPCLTTEDHCLTALLSLSSSTSLMCISRLLTSDISLIVWCWNSPTSQWSSSGEAMLTSAEDHDFLLPHFLLVCFRQMGPQLLSEASVPVGLGITCSALPGFLFSTRIDRLYSRADKIVLSKPNPNCLMSIHSFY